MGIGARREERETGEKWKKACRETREASKGARGVDRPTKSAAQLKTFKLMNMN